MLPARSRLICMDLSHPLCSLHSGERRLKLGRASSQRECGRNCNLLLKGTGSVFHVLPVTAPSEDDHSGAILRRILVRQRAMISHISSLRLSSGHSGPVLTLSNASCASLFNPHLLVVDASLWATSLLGVAVRHISCGVYFFIFLLPVMLPSDIPQLPTEPPVRGYPGI